MKKLLTLSFLLLLAGSLQAQTQWTIDTTHSSVQFKVTHMLISSVTGSFRSYSGTLRCGEQFSNAQVSVTVQTESIFTDHIRRDMHLRADDFFGAETYPEIRFSSSSFTEIAENRYLIVGDLSIRDVTKPVELVADYKGSIIVAGKEMAGFEAKGTINRFDFGLQWDDTLDSGSLVVGETVDLILNIKFTRAAD